jgi:prepilin-type N-terminal cleavage/methylation domain-containing protein
MSAVHRVPKGFTLVELMVVVAIIGILASVAVPNFMKYTLRAKASERVYVNKEIRRGVEDYWTLNGRFPQGSATASTLYCSYNPPFPPTTTKRPMQVRAWDDWKALNLQVEGTLYNSYYVYGQANPFFTYYYPLIYGDIDGNKIYYVGWTFRQLNNGVWQDLSSYPPPGSPQADYF